MSVADMISQLGNTAPAIAHLNIPSYQWWAELPQINSWCGVHWSIEKLVKSTVHDAVQQLECPYWRSWYIADKVFTICTNVNVCIIMSYYGENLPLTQLDSHWLLSGDFPRWSEALHGVANSPGVSFTGKVCNHLHVHPSISVLGKLHIALFMQVHNATSFPQVIGVAATFNRFVFYENLGSTWYHLC